VRLLDSPKGRPSHGVRMKGLREKLKKPPREVAIRSSDPTKQIPVLTMASYAN
jgi:hypothetical protein